MRKTLATVMASTLLLTGVLTGCSSNNDAAGSQGSDSGNKQVSIDVWAMGEEAKSLPTLAEEFMKENPDIKVNVQALPWDTAHDKLLTAVASKKGPDVVQMGTTWIPEFASANALMDLSSYVDKYPEIKQDNFYPGSVETGTYEDKYVGVPWYIDTRVLYYRTDLLAEVGYPEAPKTWDELADAAQKLAARGEGKYGISLDPKEQSLGFMFARQNGSELFGDNNTPLFNQPEFVGAVEYLNSFFENGSNATDIGVDAIQGLAGDGIVPMFISGPWMVKMINEQAPELAGKWATAVLPAKDNNISTLGGSNLSVFQYAKQPDAAMKFVAYMSKPETQLKWMELTTSMPSTQKAWEDEALQNDANYKVIGEQLKTAQPMPIMKEFEEIAQNFLTSFEKIYRGTTDVQTEMDAFNKKAEQILSK